MQVEHRKQELLPGCATAATQRTLITMQFMAQDQLVRTPTFITRAICSMAKAILVRAASLATNAELFR
jgi:hypothetical protein